MSENLYELSNELACINDEIINAQGEITEELEARLDTLNLALDKKAEGIGRWMLNLTGRQESLNKEIDRLTARKKAAKNLQGRLKEYIKDCMNLVGKIKLEFSALTLRVQKNPASVEIVDEKAIPAKYLTIIPEQKIVDKKAVLDDLKKGVRVEGAVLVNDKTHLRLR